MSGEIRLGKSDTKQLTCSFDDILHKRCSHPGLFDPTGNKTNPELLRTEIVFRVLSRDAQSRRHNARS